MKYKIGLVGCGRIAKNHFDAIREEKNLQLVAVCDIDKKKAEAAGKEQKIPFFTDLKKMLEDVPMDIISICTPSGIHPQNGILAAEHGVHVVTEKPMATKLEEADALIKACDKNKVHLFVVKQNRLNATMKLLKSAIDKGRFGKIYQAAVNVFWQRPQEYYDQSKWRGTWEFDGGAFMNQASHYVDALEWLIGEPESVMAMTTTMARKIESEDMGAAVVRFRNGVIATINVSMLTFPKNYEGSITILGEKGTVKIGGIAVNSIEKWEFEDYDDDDKIVFESNYNPPNIYGFGHLGYYQNVVQVLEGVKEPNTDGRGGRKSLELNLAIYKSSQTGKRIALPLSL
ncbi:MAG: Gfo/Idh/MocA family oxidoreductase [Calditrichia bacterium]|nr:Gfo/Idh/MocA family oxidoreductase [Calditrichia bacterium]